MDDFYDDGQELAGQVEEPVLGDDGSEEPAFLERVVFPVLKPVLQPVLDHLGLQLNRHTIFFLLISLFVLTRLIKTLIRRKSVRHKYEGPTDSRGRLHGEGKVTYMNGDHYVGGFTHGRKDGHGTYSYANGCSMAGSWEGGVLRKGVETYRDGSRYSGNFNERGERHGPQGEMQLPERGTYTGAFEDGKRQGWGVFRFQDGSRYTGWWTGNQRQGLGLSRASGKNGAESWGLWEADQLQRAVPEDSVPEATRKLVRQALWDKINWPQLTEAVRENLRKLDAPSPSTDAQEEEELEDEEAETKVKVEAKEN